MGASVGGEPDSRELVATGGSTPTNGTPFRSELAPWRGFATAVARGGGSMGMSDGSSLGTALGATLGAAGFEDAALGTLLQGAASQVASSPARAPADAARLASMGWPVGAEIFEGAALGVVLLGAAPRAAPLGLTGAVIELELASAGGACEASTVLREGLTLGTALGEALIVDNVKGTALGAEDWGATPR
jgi:hypothetical protein